MYILIRVVENKKRWEETRIYRYVHPLSIYEAERLLLACFVTAVRIYSLKNYQKNRNSSSKLTKELIIEIFFNDKFEYEFIPDTESLEDNPRALPPLCTYINIFLIFFLFNKIK